MGRRKSESGGEKKKESAVSIQQTRRKRQKDVGKEINKVPVPIQTPPSLPVTIPFDDGTKTATFGVVEQHGGGSGKDQEQQPQQQTMRQKSQFSPASTRKQKMKKKMKDMKKKQQQKEQQQENNDENNNNNNEVGVQESEYKPPTGNNKQDSIRRRKKTSKGKKNQGGDDSKKERKQDSPSRRAKRKPTKMCSDELCISSDLHNKGEEAGGNASGTGAAPSGGNGIGGDEKSTPEKSQIIDGRVDWVQSCYDKRVKGIVKEFSKTKEYFPVMSFTVCSANEGKNRYADVLCADETRVILKNRRPNKDYIHASWLYAPVPGSQRYICAQGPMDDSITDFWQMIFQEKCPIIVMLCGITENGFEKCSQYWPLGVGEVSKHGKFKLKNEKIEATDIDSIKCTSIKVENLKPQTGEDAILTVLHYHWADWPDHVSPAEPGPATELLKVVKEKAKGAPIVVHCSAGIGRTGTFCGIDYANDRIRTNAKIKMPEIVHEMRRQRVHSVQSNPQYVYIHLCLIHHLIETKIVAETDETKQFFADYKKYMDAVRQRVGKNQRHRREKAAEKEKEKDGSE